MIRGIVLLEFLISDNCGWLEMGWMYVKGICLIEDVKLDIKSLDVKGVVIIGYEMVFINFER